MGDLIQKYPSFDMTKEVEWTKLGQPLAFTPEEFKACVNSFFEYCETEKKPLTISRLAVYLCCDRKTLCNYSHKDAYMPTIKRIKMLIEAEKNENLISGKGSTIGLIFDLKNNHDWKDEHHLEVIPNLIPVTLAEDEEGPEIIDITPKKKELTGDKIVEEK